ncbi:MAG: hypothetical protein RLZZ630_106 [Bacteroidota bacterium]
MNRPAMNRTPFLFLRFALLLTFALPHVNSLAQNSPIGSWRDHLPYLRGKKVAVARDRIYCSSDEGFFAYRPDDQEVQRISRLNGLNDFQIQDIAYSKSNKVLVIVYTNTNIDLLYDDGSVFNMSDIKRKNIPGNKTVRSVSIDGDFAYLGCGFGIVVINLPKREIKDTYTLTTGSSPDVLAVTTDDTCLYAACDDGVYRAALNDPFLSNPNGWTRILADSAGGGTFNQIARFRNLLMVNYRKNNADTLLAWNGSWGAGLPNDLRYIINLQSLHKANNELTVTEYSRFSVYDIGFNLIRRVDQNVIIPAYFADGMRDPEGNCWLADREKGLIRVAAGSNTWEKIFPQGPYSSRIAAMQVVDGTLWTVHGPRSRNWLNAYRYDGFSYFDGVSWKTFDAFTAQTPLFSQYNFFDNMSLSVDPSDKEHLFIGSSGAGLLEFKNDQVVAHYDTANSTLLAQVGNPTQYKVHGLSYDRDGNVWVSNAGTAAVIQVLKADRTWKRFFFPGAVNSTAITGDMVIDDLGYIWISTFQNLGGKEGILVFNPNYTIDNTADDRFELVDFALNRVRCLAKDQDGTIWAGTEAGVYVFYPPSTLPQQILIKQNNTFQYLLAAEIVTAIAVDGANRKWVGTENGGLFLFSPDGQEQVLHFTTANSPLFSDNITSLAIDGKSGEVYIGTDKGLLSYRSDAITPEEEVVGCGNVLVYPNPVRSEYSGPIAIQGLIPNGSVRIADIHGGLVYQTTALGTQAVWNGTDNSGNRVPTGVYVVYSTDEAGEFSCVTKVMVYR